MIASLTSHKGVHHFFAKHDQRPHPMMTLAVIMLTTPRTLQKMNLTIRGQEAPGFESWGI